MSWNGKRVLLKSPLGTHSGYGRDGIHMIEALLDYGAEVHIEPTNVSVPLSAQIASLFAVRRPNHFDLMLHHLDPEQLKATPRMKEVADRIVAWTMWEFTGFGGEAWEHRLGSYLENYTDILGYDETSVEALRGYHHDEQVLRILQGGYKSKDWQQEEERDWAGIFRFVMVGALNSRKNPWVAIEAFRLLKEKHGDFFDAELHFKNLAMTLHPKIEEWTPGIKIHYESWTHEQMRAFYESAHCYVGPSWGEGKNLPAIEAASMGLPVILSECGGHKQWFDSSIGWMTQRSTWEQYDAVRKPGQESLRVDVEELANLMFYAFLHRDESMEKGATGSRLVPAQCDWSVVIKRLDTVLWG